MTEWRVFSFMHLEEKSNYSTIKSIEFGLFTNLMQTDTTN